MNDLRTEAVNRALERTLTRARLSKYLIETESDFDSAVSLYERNTRLSEALYTTLQGLEICLRNVVNAEMAAVYGVDWLTNGAPRLELGALSNIERAMSEIQSPTADDLVAQLKFAFWVGLLAPRYDSTLWRSAIYKAFRANTGKKRSDVHSRMNALRRFRNRVAHHEPIFQNAKQMHDEAIEAISWMCTGTREWVAARSNFNSVNQT